MNTLDHEDAMQYTPAALKIPEILENIFSFADEQSNRNVNVLVCKRWSEPCMNIIWSELDNLGYVVRLLGPISFTYSMSAEFVNNKEPLKWDRFSFYARRVWRIACRPDRSRPGAYARVFSEIAFSRPSAPLFPNLKTLQWYGETYHCRENFFFMFMESTLQHYALHEASSSLPGSALSLVLRTVAERCPCLDSVKVVLGSDGEGVGDTVLEFVEKMVNVKSIELSAFKNMIPFTSTLRKIAHLEELIIGYQNSSQFRSSIESLATPFAGSNSFARLAKFCIVASYSIAEEFFSLAATFPSMKKIYIASDLAKPETPMSVKHLLELFATKCPNLDALCLSYSSLAQAKQPSRLPPASCIVKSLHLRPLLGCARIRNFEFNHPYPVSVDDSFAEEMAVGWPDLLKLSLTPVPSVQRKDFKNTFTLRALLSFARHCRHLHHLAILISTESSTCPTISDIQELPPQFFCGLSILDVGSSLLYEADLVPITRILGHLLPDKCQLNFDELSTMSNREGGKSRWKSVKGRIRFVRWMELETGSRIRALERENKTLRARLNASFSTSS
ncbi:hypothetical protein D9757_007647 [Collybiopsis confluens]|uniref:F-box domain-containing protein n=1 Tax=Collybiopsis confluens TaxID=2823264 RepID=A0A8H5H9P6_9AGAR|nr:hypothetical protein D9757_007647 [Collybiopsis confluens]